MEVKLDDGALEKAVAGAIAMQLADPETLVTEAIKTLLEPRLVKEGYGKEVERTPLTDAFREAVREQAVHTIRRLLEDDKELQVKLESTVRTTLLKLFARIDIPLADAIAEHMGDKILKALGNDRL